MIDRDRKSCVVAVAFAAIALAGCGAEEQEQAPAAPVPTTQAPGGPLPPKATTAERTENRLPSEAQIKSAQKVAIKPRPAPKTQAARQQESVREVDAKPGRTTAPADVLELSRRAARHWLNYRINGDTPSAGVIPGSVWDGVPPAAPDVRMKGRALTTDLHAFSAHPEGKGWIVSVSTRDPRLPVIVVDVMGPASSARVQGITG